MKSYDILDVIDARKWKELQTDFYKNQIESMYSRYIKDNKIPSTQYERDVYIECFLRECDCVFRQDKEYISFCQYWAMGCEDEFKNEFDENTGYYYTKAVMSECKSHYEWEVL